MATLLDHGFAQPSQMLQRKLTTNMRLGRRLVFRKADNYMIIQIGLSELVVFRQVV